MIGRSQLRTIVVGTDQLTSEITDWLNEYCCEIEEGDVVIVSLPRTARITDLAGDRYAIDFPMSRKYLEVDLDVDVFTTSWELKEVGA